MRFHVSPWLVAHSLVGQRRDGGHQLEGGRIAALWQFVPGVTEPLDNALP